MSKQVNLEELRKILGAETETETKTKKVEVDSTLDLEELSNKVVELSKETLKPKITEVISEVTEREYQKQEARLNAVIDELRVEAKQLRKIEVKNGKTKTVIEGVQHKQFDNLLKIVAADLPVLLVGAAGTGKTHAGETVAKALGLTFHPISVGAQTSKSDIQGFINANGNYITTQFREAYEKGGLFLLDEADAGNSNVLITLNAALSNGYYAFPDKLVPKHENFRIVATANTFGTGADRQYVGRNQLDAATLDRFSVLNWDIDELVEESLAGDNKKWLNVVRAVRKRVLEQKELRVVVSPRAVIRGASLLEQGISFDEVLSIALIGNIPAHHHEELQNIARAVWMK